MHLALVLNVVSPSALLFPDLSQLPPLREEPPLAPAEVAQRLKRARHEFQRGMLKWLKNDPAGMFEMKSAAAAVESTQRPGSTRAFWWVTLALLEALAEGGIAVDDEVKRLCARIEAQMRKPQEGSGQVPEQLMRDVLYRVALASPGSEEVERVRKAYRLDELLSAPAMPAQNAMRDTLTAAKKERNGTGDREPGGIILSKTIYDIYLAEARGHLDTLERELQLLAEQAPTEEMIRAAHTLGGISDTIGRAPIKDLALALARALARFSALGAAPDSTGHAALEQAVNALREMTEAVALRRLPEARAPLAAALDALAPIPSGADNQGRP